MKLIRLCLVLLLLCFTTTYAGSMASQTLSEQLKQLQSMQADFIQTTKAMDDRVLQQSSGSMALQRPGKFRWVIEKPNKQLIIANNNKLWIYDEDLAQVTVKSMNNGYNSPALLLSNSNDDLIKKFSISQPSSQLAGTKMFLLQPKQKHELYTSLQLFFAAKGNSLQKIVMTDGLGQITTVSFKHARINTPIASNLFQMTIPHGVEVIKD